MELGSLVTYREVSKLHPQHQGIYTSKGVAVSILFSLRGKSPYPDKWVKEGAVLDYTGQGRSDQGDQAWDRYNLGMRRAMEEGRPVHVFEKLGGKPVMYKYHGEWVIIGLHEKIVDATGQKVFRFLLSAEPEDQAISISSTPMFSTGALADDICEPAARFLAVTQRIIRDTQLARRLKEAYGFRCQVCGQVRRLGTGDPYAEAHHVRPLGRPHDGPDSVDNLVILCPNHHADFDYGALGIDPGDGETLFHKFDASLQGTRIHRRRGHRLNPEHLRYHMERTFR